MSRTTPVPPSPPSLPLLGHAWQLLRRPGAFLLESTRRFGPSIQLRYGPTSALIVTSPAATRELLVDRASLFVKGYQEMRLVFGNGLIMAEGDVWRRHRRIILPLLRTDAVAVHVPAFVAATREMLDAWQLRHERGETVDGHAEITALTLRIAGITLFGTDLRDDTRRVCDAATTVTRALFQIGTRPMPLPLWVPLPSHRAVRRWLAVLDDLAARMIAERRRDPRERTDVLSQLMRATDDAGKPLSDVEVRDDIVTLLMAGHETTANVLAWTLAHVASDRAVATRVRDAVTAAWPDDEPGLGAIAAVRAVLFEAMRLHPPGWLLERTALEDVVIDGYLVRKGSRAAACPFVTHRDPGLWPEPDRFDPGRFDGPAGHERDRHAHLAFGAGPRGCVGMSFAMLEMQTILGLILQRFDLGLAPDARIEPDFVVTLRPRHGVPLRLSTLRRANPT